MLNRLLRLYNKQHQSGKTPLEDFTTEALVGLFEAEPQLLQFFCKAFLKLNSENFRISSQRKYPLKDETDCIIDIVIEGENEICFIENKVNSSEGYKQILRYCMILDEYKNNKQFSTKMVYCTKFSEPKDEDRHNFVQIKWYEVANFLKQKNKEKQSDLITIFLNFLKEHKMNQDLTLTAIDLIALQNYNRATAIMKGHLDRANPFFEQTIGKIKLVKKFELDCNRYSHCNYDERAILYYISFAGKLHVDIWFPNTHSKSLIFKDCVKKYLLTPENNGLGLWEDENSSCICISKPLSDFLDDEQGDMKILEWFKYAFDEMKKFIDFSKDKIVWNI